ISIMMKDVQLVAYYGLYLAQYFMSMGNLDTANALLSKALNLIEEYGNQVGQVAILQALARLSQLKNDNENWKSYLDQAIDLSSKINHDEGLVLGYSNMARYYIHMDDIDGAEKNLYKAEKYNTS